MTNSQIAVQIEVLNTMIGEYVSRMNPLAPADDMANVELCKLTDQALDEIDRLERTLAVRQTVKGLCA